jgi:hypothetical protein
VCSYHLLLSVPFSAVFIIFKLFSLFVVTVAADSTAVSASIYHYRRHSKSSIPHGKLTQPPPLHLGSSFPPPNLEKGHIRLVVVTTTSPAHTELAL